MIPPKFPLPRGVRQALAAQEANEIVTNNEMALSMSNLSVSSNSISKYDLRFKPYMSPICSSERSRNLRTTEEYSWNRQVAPKLACMIIGVGAGLLSGEVGLSAAAPADNTKTEVMVQQGRSVRWSDARRCPQWSPNSLETLVPENLPRPWNRRNNEVGFFDTSAPRLRASAGGGSCFTL